MQTIDPVGFLYQKPNAIPFAEYAPEAEFAYKQKVVVARLPAVDGAVHNAVISEVRVPAVLLRGIIYEDTEPRLQVGISTGADLIPVFYAVCKGFTDGSISLTATPNHTVQVSMWEDSEGPFVCFAEAGALNVLSEKPMVTMYFKDRRFAKKVAREMLSDLLGVRWYTP